VFSWSGCPFCKRAKAVLDATGAKYTALSCTRWRTVRPFLGKFSHCPRVKLATHVDFGSCAHSRTAVHDMSQMVGGALLRLLMRAGRCMGS